MSDREPAAGPRRPADPHDPFYDDPYDPDDTAGPGPVDAPDRTSRAEAEHQIEAVVGEILAAGTASLTFARVSAGARTGFTAEEVEQIRADPALTRHLLAIWRLSGTPAAVRRIAQGNDARAAVHRALLEAGEQPVIDVPVAGGRVEELQVGGPRHRPSRAALVLGAIVAAACLVAAAVIGVTLARRPAQPAGTPAPSASAPSPAEPSASVELPRSTPLSTGEFVIPRTVDAGRALYVGRVDGGGSLRLLTGSVGHRAFAPSLSPDRSSLIYIDQGAGLLRTSAVDGSGDRVLFDRPLDGCDQPGHASWSPSDSKVLVLVCVQASGADRLVVVDLAGRLIRTLDAGRIRVDDPTISPDGRAVAFWGSDAGSGDGGSLFWMPLDGSAGPTALTHRPTGSDADPAWSPDGDTIAFRRRGADGSKDIYLVRADGTGLRPLLTGPAQDEKPAWSPNGRRLLVVSDRTGTGTGAGSGPGDRLYLINADGTGLRPTGVSGESLLTASWWHR